MAKKHHSSTVSHRRFDHFVRVNNYYARPPLYDLKKSTPIRNTFRPSTQYYPTRPRRVVSSQYRIIPSTQTVYRGLSPLIASTAVHDYHRLKMAVVCARRQIRREVILATGRGGARHRPQKFNSNSRIHC